MGGGGPGGTEYCNLPPFSSVMMEDGRALALWWGTQSVEPRYKRKDESTSYPTLGETKSGSNGGSCIQDRGGIDQHGSVYFNTDELSILSLRSTAFLLKMKTNQKYFPWNTIQLQDGVRSKVIVTYSRNLGLFCSRILQRFSLEISNLI